MCEKNILMFVVQDAVYANDGYKARLEMEMGLLKDYYEFVIFAPNIKVAHPATFLNHVHFEYFESSSTEKPFFFDYWNIRRDFVNVLKKYPGNIIVVFEGMQTASLIYDICVDKKIKYIYDCHGSMPSEVQLYHNKFIGGIYSHYLTKAERKIILNAETCITVSEKQFNYWKMNVSHICLPMLPSDIFLQETNSKSSIRKKIDIPDEETVFVYSGQNQKWQLAEETIKFYKRIEEKNKSTFLLILTHDTEDFEEFIFKYRVKNYKVLSVQYVDMPQYLDACDYGFCLRGNDMTNIVASPTKVLEYLARGVKPILTQYVGDFSEYLGNRGLADVVSIDDNYILKNEKTKMNTREFVKEMKARIIIDYINTLRKLSKI